MVTIEIDLREQEIIKEVQQLFPDCDYYEKYSIGAGDVAQIITSLTALLAVLGGSTVLVQYLKNKIITIKIDNIEYIGTPENLPSFVKNKIKEKNI